MFFIKKFPVLAYFYLAIFFQIILESFPISSSGHLKLLEIINQKFEIFFPISLENFGLNFEILHLPTIFIFFIFFQHNLKLLLINMFKSWKFLEKISIFIFIADFITVIFYFFFKYLNFDFPLWLGFFITGIYLFSLLFCTCHPELVSGSGSRIPGFAKATPDKQVWDDSETRTIKHAFLVGLVQGISLLPGISRFGSTFVALRWLKYEPQTAFFFSFLIEMPLLFAGVLKGFYSLHATNQLLNLSNINLEVIIIIFMASFISYQSLNLMKKIIEKNRVWMISFYMLIPAMISLYLSLG